MCKKHSFLCVVVTLCLVVGCGRPQEPANKNAEAAAAPEAPTPPAAPASGGVTLVKDGASPHFAKVVSRLELGASSFSYEEYSGGTMLFAAILDDIVKSLPESERKQVPASFSFANLFDILGLNAVKAVGSSTRKVAEDYYHSRSFAYIPGVRKGLLTLAGAGGRPLVTLGVAPKDTDLALEFPLCLKDFTRDAFAKVLDMVPQAERATAEQKLTEKVPPLGISVREMLEKTDARIALIARIDPSQTTGLSASGVHVPGLDAALVIDGLGWLLESLKQQMLPMLSSPAGPFAMTDAGGILTITSRQPLMPGPAGVQPVLRFDAKADRVIITTRPAFLDAMMKEGGQITGQPAFEKAWQGLPRDGNASLYVSPRFLGQVTDSIRKSMASGAAASKDRSGFDVANKVLDYASAYMKNGQASVMSAQPDGLLTVSNTSLPMNPSGTSSSLTTISVISILASAAVPTFNTVQDKANQAKALGQGRQVAIALKLYASNHDGKYPAELNELMKAGVLDNADNLLLQDPATKQRVSWLYDATLTDSSPGVSVVLASPFILRGGKRLIVRNDSSAEAVTEAEFQRTGGGKLR